MGQGGNGDVTFIMLPSVALLGLLPVSGRIWTWDLHPFLTCVELPRMKKTLQEHPVSGLVLGGISVDLPIF